VNVAIDGPVASTWEQGREIYYTRFGQLELSCANCHEQNYGNNIRADHLSQGQINGFPTYRLKQANLVSVHNRFRGCIRDTRAETFRSAAPNSWRWSFTSIARQRPDGRRSRRPQLTTCARLGSHAGADCA
jgi:sulfur oxidation c-type cytochrome SoxA